MDKKHAKKGKAILIIWVNIVLGAVIVSLLFAYRSDYRAKLNQQNLNDISNINQSTANVAGIFFQSQTQKMKDIMKYQQNNHLSLKGFLQYLAQSNANENSDFQLVDQKFRGYCVDSVSKKQFEIVNYENSNYKELQKILSNSSQLDHGIAFTSEFTDGYSGMNSFALYVYLSIADENNVTHSYTLMKVLRTSNFLGIISQDGGYNEMDNVIINHQGDYVLSSPAYRANNFFEYISTYNELSLDQKNAVRSKMLSKKKGVLYYNNIEQDKTAYVYTTIAGTDWYSVSGVSVKDFHDNQFDIRFTMISIVLLFFLMFFDIVCLLHFNHKTKESAQEAFQANAAKTDFLSRMSHDIRTPINVINGMTELAVNEEDPGEVKEYLQNIHSSGQFLLGLVNDILDLNKVESSKMEMHPKPYPYKEFYRYITAVINPLCEEKGVTFTIDCNEPNTTIFVDQLRINQVFFNLLSNAVKFTKTGGHVSLDCKVSTVEGGSPSKRKLVFHVADDGIGMSKEFQKTMFEAFLQESKEYTPTTKGTGLGLAIVKKIVELMNGEIKVDSEEGKGTTFTLTFLTAIVECGEEEITAEYDESIIAGKHILLCEDHPLNTKIAVKLLENRGAIIDCAENGQEGLERFQASQEGFYDVVLMDIRMPIMDGLEATKNIRALANREDAKEVPIIALTANAYDVDMQSSREAGANAHLSKPIDSHLLYQTLARFLEEKK